MNTAPASDVVIATSATNQPISGNIDLNTYVFPNIDRAPTEKEEKDILDAIYTASDDTKWDEFIYKVINNGTVSVIKATLRRYPNTDVKMLAACIRTTHEDKIRLFIKNRDQLQAAIDLLRNDENLFEYIVAIYDAMALIQNDRKQWCVYGCEAPYFDQVLRQ